MHPEQNPTTAAATPDRTDSGRSEVPAVTVVGAIPARWGSTRLPGKPLVEIAGRPLVEHVYRRAARAEGLARVVVLTDDERIAAAVDRFGGEWMLTPADCASGTDRIAWAVREWPEGAVVNIQGDEPLIDPAVISRLAAHLGTHPDDPVVTFAAPAAADEAVNPHAVKVVLDRRGYALYFSRAPIPYPRRATGDGGTAPLKHLGIYGYRKSALLELAALPPSPLETTEALEQLRALENGIPIRVLLTDAASPGVDTGEDLARVEALLAGQTGTEKEAGGAVGGSESAGRGRPSPPLRVGEGSGE